MQLLKLSVKKILNKEGNKYSDDEVGKIRTLLICFAEIELEQYRKKNETEATFVKGK